MSSNNDSNKSEIFGKKHLLELEANKKSVNLADSITKTIAQKIENEVMIDYGSSYSGMFIDANDVLHIAHTGKVEVNYSKLINYCNTENIETSIDVVPYSLNELMSVKTFIDNNLYEMISQMSLSRTNNKVIIRLKDESMKEEMINSLKENLEDFDEGMIEFSLEKDTVKACANTISAGEELMYKEGWWIFAKKQWSGSVGFNAIDNNNGTKGIVTTYHVAPIGYEMRNSKDKVVGTATIGALAGSVDASFIPFADQDTWDTTRAYGGDKNYILLSREQSYEGAKAALFGYATGISYGTIVSADTSATIDYLDTPRYLTDIVQSNCSMAAGDSGGPLTTCENSQYQFIYGINFARDANYAYTIKIQNILDTLNVKIC